MKSCSAIAMFAISFIILLPTHHVSARQEDPHATLTVRDWAFEIDLIQPLVPTIHVIRPKFTWTVWRSGEHLRGDLLLGGFIRPHIKHDIVETIDEYMLTLGYRQYLWKELHVEAGALVGYAWGTNKFDGKFYETPTLFLEINAGYRFAFFQPGGFFDNGTDSHRFYVATQIGFIFSGGISSIGPRDGKPDYFAQGALLVGRSF